MFRFILAALAAITLAACSPAPKIDAADPYKSLYPWNPKWKGVVTLDSGVQYIVIKKGEGKGEKPKPEDRVEVNYDGRFASNGEQFDTSYGKEPAVFRLNQVISGWTEGLQYMQPGDEFMFWIPWKLAYGEDGRPGIPPKADLMFRVELRSVVKAVASNAEAWKKVTPWPTDSSDVNRSSTGLEYLVVESGPADGPVPGDRDYAIVHLEGRLDDGSVVGSTFESQEPEIFPVADLVPGWAEAIKGMHKGDHWMIRMPAHLMYAGEGDGRIPPNAIVTYEVILDDVIVVDTQPAEPAAPATPK